MTGCVGDTFGGASLGETAVGAAVMAAARGGGDAEAPPFALAADGAACAPGAPAAAKPPAVLAPGTGEAFVRLRV